MANVSEEIRAALLSLKDDEYKKFHSKLMPTVNPESIIGIKIPVLRKFAVQVIKKYSSDEIITFMKDLPHKYYEENNLHAFLIEKIDDYEKCLYALDDFLPYVNNWATCDSLRPKCFKKNTDILLPKIKEWIGSDKAYTVRFGIGSLMKFYLDNDFNPDFLHIVSEIHSEEYYVNMMRAWFFATALAKQYDEALPYISEKKLDVWTHNKTIQKAVESKRVSNKQKEELKKYKL